MVQKMFAFQQNHVGTVAEKSAVSKAALGEAAMTHVVGQRNAVIAPVTLKGHMSRQRNKPIAACEKGAWVSSFLCVEIFFF